MSYRFILTTGGTGGHIFPALALANKLKDQYQCPLLFAGGRLSSNPYFRSDLFPSKDISCSSQQLRGAFQNIKGVVEAIQLLSDYAPDAVIGFGSYYTWPVLTAAYLLEIPILLHEANSIPGKVNRWFSPHAAKTWIFFSEAQKKLRGVVEECKMPLRSQFQRGAVSRQEALSYFRLGHQPTLLVFGGSQGAKGVNALFTEEMLRGLKGAIPSLQLIHLTGGEHEAVALSKRYEALQIPSYVKPFETRMELAWAAADIALTRAGACSIAEQYEYRVPGVLIPFPGATDNHQDFNADKLIQAGLAVKIKESQATAVSVVEALKTVFYKSLDVTEWNQEYELSERIMGWMERNITL